MGAAAAALLLLSIDLVAARPREPATETPAEPVRGVTIRWLGHACFLVTSSRGTRILMDPVGLAGHVLPADLAPHAVTISHDHPDHAALHALELPPGVPVLRGVDGEGVAWVTHDVAVEDVAITSVGTFHDMRRGAERGLSSAFRLVVDGVSIVHLGDLGHMLTPVQVARLGTVDVLMVPVGGRDTLTPRDATEVVAQLRPRLAVLPMHCRTLRADGYAFSAEDFARGRPGVRQVDGATVTIDPAGSHLKEPETILLSVP